MANIAGIYRISAKLNAQYTLTGNDRDADFTISAPDVPLDLSCTSSSTTAYVKPIYDGILKIKRVRLVSAGAPGLQRPELHRAANFNLSVDAADENGIYTNLDSVIIKIDNWNEWNNVNHDLRPFKTYFTFTDSQINQHKPVTLFARYMNSEFYCDDYNLQAAYIGQTFTPYLEMEIESTAGMVETSQYNLI